MLSSILHLHMLLMHVLRSLGVWRLLQVVGLPAHVARLLRQRWPLLMLCVLDGSHRRHVRGVRSADRRLMRWHGAARGRSTCVDETVS